MARLSYHIEGGIAVFPGLAAERAVDTEALPEPEREELLELFGTVSERRSSSAAAESAADHRTYVIELQEENGVRCVTVSEFDRDPQARALVKRLRSCTDRS